MGPASAPRERAQREGLSSFDAGTLTDVFRDVPERAFGLPFHRRKFVARSFQRQDQFGELEPLREPVGSEPS